jgi:hypothetical protein
VYIGRERETKKIIKLLDEGFNVILKGRFGIGRSSLARHVARVTGDRWGFVFVDFSETPGKVCKRILKSFRSMQTRYKRETVKKYRSNRSLLARMDRRDGKKNVLVLDNIEKITKQRLNMLTFINAERRYQFIAIAEDFLAEKDLFLLRSNLLPAELVMIGYMKIDDTLKVFRHFSSKHNLGWNEDQIHSFAELSGGYPLGMKEIMDRVLKRGRKAHK